jgi:SAM-dependent methyltransferase
MTDSAPQADTDSATAYQELFVPALFQQWTPHVVAAAKLQLGHRVLDVACGTGVLAREAASFVGSTGSVVGVDPSAGMLIVAKRLAPEIEWRQGTAESLPYADESFDAVISQFGLMFFTDRRQGVREMLRVLSPGGHLAVAVWDSLDNTPAYADAVALLDRVAGQRAADALRAPFSLGDRNELATLFAELGLTSSEIATRHGTARFPSIRSMVEADLRGWLPVMGVVLSEDLIARILKEAEHVLSRYVTAQGRVAFESPAHIVTGTKRVVSPGAG